MDPTFTSKLTNTKGKEGNVVSYTIHSLLNQLLQKKRSLLDTTDTCSLQWLVKYVK